MLFQCDRSQALKSANDAYALQGTGRHDIDTHCNFGENTRSMNNPIAFLAFAAVASISISACKKKVPDFIMQEQRQANANLAAYAPAISSGLSNKNKIFIFPGTTTILSELASATNSGDTMRRIFQATYLKQLQEYQKWGLITLEEQQQSQLSLVGGLGARHFIVRATPYAESIVEKIKATSSVNPSEKIDAIVISVGACAVTEIVKDVEYHNPKFSKADTYRLCVGRYTYKQTEFGKKHYAELGFTLKPEYKFRALIKLNPFNNSFSYVDSDWGYLDNDEWESNNVQ